MIRRAMIVVAVSAFAVIGFAGAAGAETLSAGSLVAKQAGVDATAAARVNATVAGADLHYTVTVMTGKANAMLAGLHS